MCGVTDAYGVRAAVRAGADAVGLNLVPGTPRELTIHEAAELARIARNSGGSTGHPPAVVAVTADADMDRIREIVARVDPDAVQLSGWEPPHRLAAIERPAWKVLHLPADEPSDVDAVAATIVVAGRRYLAAGAARLLLDTAGGVHPGGTGRRSSERLAAAVAREVPVVLAGGLGASGVAAALRTVQAIGVDVASGVEAPRARDERPRQA